VKKKYKIKPFDKYTATPEYESADPMERYYQQRKVRFIRSEIRKIMKKNPGKIADLGCGEGVFLDFSNKLNQQMLTIGVDFGRKNCEKTRIKGHNSILADVEFLPLKTNSIEAVFLLDVIEHLFEQKVLSEIYRVLKENGELLLSTPNKFGIYEHKQLVYVEDLFLCPEDIWNALKGKPRGYAPYHVKLYSKKELIRVLQDRGFLVLESKTIGFCFPFLGTIKNIFLIFKRNIFESKIKRILEIFEKKVEVFNFEIIIHGCKTPKKDQC